MTSITHFKAIFKNDREWKAVMALIEESGIRLDENIDATYAFYDERGLVGTASTLANTIKSIAIKPSERGSNLLGEMINETLNVIYAKGFSNVFVYTKCEWAQTFSHLGFYEVERVEAQVVLLERKPSGVAKFTQMLNAMRTTYDDIGAIVMNANPFTLGHQYLIEYASSHCEFLYIFVVESDHSSFPCDDRYKMILAGSSHLDNVYVVKGGDYVISDATFPSYFLKKPEEATELQTELDLKIFGHYFVNTLSIKKRFVGTEPYCETTNLYNQMMKKILPKYGVEIIEIPRKTTENEAISASKVRELLKENRMVSLKELVPETTFKYLKSAQGKKIIERLKQKQTRH